MKSPCSAFALWGCSLNVRFRLFFLPCLATVALAQTASPEKSAAVKTEIKVSGAALIDRERVDGILLQLSEETGQAAVEFNYPAKALDLSGYRDLAVKVDNRASAELDVLITGTSDSTSFSRSTQTRFFVLPGEQTDLRVLMTRPALPKDHPLVQRLGNLYAFPWGHQRHWQHMDNANILRVTVRLEWLGARTGQIVKISHPFGLGAYSVDPAVLETMTLPLVDMFGQARDRDWPGKITSLDELLQDAATDHALVTTITRPTEGRSRYGGEKGAPRQSATGFFRTEKIDGKWWFVDPEGHLFWSLGVNTAGNSPETRVKGREELFPEASRGADEILHYWENIKLKHGGSAEWRDKHTDVSLARMMDWGLNTIGAWSMPELAAKQRVPYTLIVHVNTHGFGPIKKIPDPYSEDFKKSLNQRLSAQAAAHAKSPWLLGVFIDNELDWKNGTELAQEILKSPPRTPARIALVEFLKTRYSDIAALNKEWGTDHISWDNLRPRSGPSAGAPAAYAQDLRDCMTEFARAYFTACAEAMDRHFPNHLYLGCRFHTFNALITAEASRHCDVMSANLYRYNVSDFSMPTAEDKPFIIGEFHFGIRDYGNWGVGLTWAADARNQSDLVQAYLSGALSNPNIIGAHWFQWANQCPTGRFDGENFGVGLLTVVDRPVTTLVDAFRSVAGALYDYRRSSATVRIGAPTTP